jgi:eukaryotic-like serine/threonine-protein kinase
VVAELQARLQAALGDAYRLERELTRGGMSRLFVATESSLNRQVVVKVLPPDFTSQVSTERFKQEIELAAHLQHPNILPVLAAGTRDNLLYYIIPYVAGESLRHRLTREGRLPVADSIRILHEVADALACAHAEGVVHRDIKPENILLERSHAVLTDFGVARALGELRSGGRLTDTGFAVGTPGYMAPEQAAGEREVDGRADVYALAVVGYEMLAGFPPFAGPTAQAVIKAHLTTTPRPLHDVRPETPPEVSNVIVRALAKDPDARLRTAAEFRDAVDSATRRQPTRHAPRRLLGVAAALLVAFGLTGTLLLRRGSPAALDSSLIAVAPFDILTPGLELWREGMVDLLSRNLDGAGPLRTVAPSVVIRQWTGRADPPSAVALGQKTGARLAVIGQLVPIRPDSVRLAAALIDVENGKSLGEVEFRNLSASMDKLSDSLTLAILRVIGESRPVGAVRATALRSTSLPALKAYLQGEQFFRRTEWDSALAAYQRAVAIDSTLALAWRRMGTVVGWTVMGGDSLSGAYILRAGALNRGMPQRDSLMITSESLFAALYTNSSDTSWRSHQGRLFTVLDEVTGLYPQDPEAWFQLGDARLHFRRVGRTSLEDVLEPFDRAIQLDSAFTESYIHAVEIAVHLGRPLLARRYIARYLRHNQGTGDQHSKGLHLVDRLLESAAGSAGEFDSILQGYSANVLFEALLAVSHSPDSLETSVHIARALFRSPRSGVPSRDSRQFRTWFLTAALGYRGHLRQAYEAGPEMDDLVSAMAPLGVVPANVAGALFGGWVREPTIKGSPDALPFGFNISVFNALPWWAAQRDTTSLRSFAERMRSLGSRSPSGSRVWLDYGAASAEAYHALARGDTAAALTGFTSLPDTVCPCVFDQIITSQLLSQKGRDQEAAAVFDGHYPPFMFPAEGLWRLQRARTLERVGRREEALEDYRFTASLWRKADPQLQPYATEARQALVRLTAEPQP